MSGPRMNRSTAVTGFPGPSINAAATPPASFRDSAHRTNGIVASTTNAMGHRSAWQSPARTFPVIGSQATRAPRSMADIPPIARQVEQDRGYATNAMTRTSWIFVSRQRDRPQGVAARREDRRAEDIPSSRPSARAPDSGHRLNRAHRRYPNRAAISAGGRGQRTVHQRHDVGVCDTPRHPGARSGGDAFR